MSDCYDKILLMKYLMGFFLFHYPRYMSIRNTAVFKKQEKAFSYNCGCTLLDQKNNAKFDVNKQLGI